MNSFPSNTFISPSANILDVWMYSTLILFSCTASRHKFICTCQCFAQMTPSPFVTSKMTVELVDCRGVCLLANNNPRNSAKASAKLIWSVNATSLLSVSHFVTHFCFCDAPRTKAPHRNTTIQDWDFESACDAKAASTYTSNFKDHTALTVTCNLPSLLGSPGLSPASDDPLSLPSSPCYTESHYCHIVVSRKHFLEVVGHM